MSDPNMDQAAIQADALENGDGAPENTSALGSTTAGDQRPTGSDDPESDDDEGPMDPITGDTVGTTDDE
ncbi:hypothetical protein [Schumannella luteola]